jgi:hypothetical protein
VGRKQIKATPVATAPADVDAHQHDDLGVIGGAPDHTEG